MAKQIDFEHLPGIIIEGTYWIPGRVVLELFHETAQVEWWGFLNEDARHQRPQLGELAELAEAKANGASDSVISRIQDKWARYRGPIKVVSLSIPQSIFAQYLSAEGHSEVDQNIEEAIYRAAQLPEPFGLAAHFKNGKDI